MDWNVGVTQDGGSFYDRVAVIADDAAAQALADAQADHETLEDETLEAQAQAKMASDAQLARDVIGRSLSAVVQVAEVSEHINEAATIDDLTISGTIVGSIGDDGKVSCTIDFSAN